MEVLAADIYILCRGPLRTLMLLYDNVCVTAASSIDEVLARIAGSPATAADLPVDVKARTDGLSGSQAPPYAISANINPTVTAGIVIIENCDVIRRPQPGGS